MDLSYLTTFYLSRLQSDFLQNLYASDGTHLEHLAGPFTKYIVQCSPIRFDCFLFHKCLNRSGKSTPMDTADSRLTQHLFTDRQCHRNPLLFYLLTGIHILKILK